MPRRDYSRLYAWKKETPPEERRLKRSDMDGGEPGGEHRRLRCPPRLGGRYRYAHTDDDPLGRGRETDDNRRTEKLLNGLRQDVGLFSSLLARRVGMQPTLGGNYPGLPIDVREDDDEMQRSSGRLGGIREHEDSGALRADHEGAEGFFWRSPYIFDVFTRRKLKGVARRLGALASLLDGKHDLADPAGTYREYASVVCDMRRYGMVAAMAKYRAFGEYVLQELEMARPQPSHP